jgi:hypothetical protein
VANLFERLQEKQPQYLEKERQVETIPRGPLLQPVVPPTDSKAPLIEQTLDWIINRWPQPAIRVRDILRFGPAAARNRKSAVALAENLAAHGWLQPLATRQHNMKMWQVVRGPSAPHGS